ncbi:hypothetical protein C8J47_1342 [Sphingomonas sp. PP-F2F-G114-C0414]|uniref:hypothetical protein n=1 Tax=Sphingomonas sp. PP-F2F-G114-C0414 TaxID=2135662 RepID=UPI000EF90089|nr:hypothetical protein [Sphingomonas sp. PP-F2F-G114-C0414]RMB35821.1 hypothetical protein C8J47_1342 [Sphingomonas sp. PP-F2F-G114-C0414]
MPVWHTLQSDQILVTQSGLHVAAMVRTIAVKAVLDPDAATTMIAEPLAKRLPHMPDHAARTATTDALPLRPTIDVKLRATYRPISQAKFGAVAPDGTMLDVGRDVLTQEMLRLDFGTGRIAAVGKSDMASLGNRSVPLRLTLTTDGYSAAWGDSPIPFHADAARQPSSVVRTVTYGALTLPVHDDGRGGRWIGWDAFAGKRIVLDLPHATIWIEKPGG